MQCAHVVAVCQVVKDGGHLDIRFGGLVYGNKQFGEPLHRSPSIGAPTCRCTSWAASPFSCRSQRANGSSYPWVTYTFSAPVAATAVFSWFQSAWSESTNPRSTP